MDKKIKSRWIKALRSGKFKQAKRSLIVVGENGENSFCCLGVLAHIASPYAWVFDGKNYTFHGNAKHYGRLGGAFQSRCGISDPDQVALIDMNDNGDSFKEIAHWIEKNL